MFNALDYVVDWFYLLPFLYVIGVLWDMKKAIFTNNSDIRLGFEIECIIKSGNRVKLRRAINSLKKGITIGSDGSLETDNWDDSTAEIRTLPLRPRDAMITLKSVFDIVNKYGGTNRTCGFHVNISSSNKRKMKNFDPLPFLSSSLWREILRRFNRTNNEFCQPTLCGFKHRTLSKVEVFRKLSQEDVFYEKYNCVNFSNFGSGTSKSSRIEIRGFGNRDYSKKFDTISAYVKKIETLFSSSCQMSSV